MGELLVGAARHSLEPPLDLPLIGFMRQTHDATGYASACCTIARSSSRSESELKAGE